MNVTITPRRLEGSVRAPASKSEAHRLLTCAALAPDVTDIDCDTTSQDIDATASCLRALGAQVTRTRLGFRVAPVPRAGDGGYRPNRKALLDCGESGSTLRFMLPVVAALGYEELVAHGSSLGEKGVMPLHVGGKLGAGTFTIAGNVSSQYVSGLLMAAPLLPTTTEVLVTEPVESLPYIDLTIAALETFGVDVLRGKATTPAGPALSLTVAPKPGYATPGHVSVGGDWSNAAFWLCAAALGNPVTLTGVDPESVQGDRAVLGALALLGARVSRSAGAVQVSPDQPHGTRIDVQSCPDLVPPLAAVAACSAGTTTITGAARLRIKESDRLETVCACVNALGGTCETTDDGLVIEGADRLAGGTVDAANDHRIAMMASVLATRCDGPVTIIGAQCVAKSYPAFFEDYASLGGNVTKEG